MLIVGNKEAEAGAVSVRLRSEEDFGAIPLDQFEALIRRDVDSKSLSPSGPTE
jgi:threonyl-tRNA synthetase